MLGKLHNQWRWLRQRPRTLIAAIVLLVIVVTQCIWKPAPNQVQVKVSGMVHERATRQLQLYYQYDIPTFRGFKEHQSESRIIHKATSPLLVTFNLPGLQPLGNMRLDFGMGRGSLKIHEIAYYYRLGPLRHHLFTLEPAELAQTWHPNNGVYNIAVNDDFVHVDLGGKDPFAIIPIGRAMWKGSLPLSDVMFLRLVRTVLLLGMFAIFWALFWASPYLWKNADVHPLPGGVRFAAPLGFFLGICGIGFIVYYPYLIHHNLYLFADVANDSIWLFWPIKIHLSEYLRSEGWPLWSFSVGIGKDIFNLLDDPFSLLHMLYEPEDVGYGFGWIQYLKVLCAGLFFYTWFRLLGLSRYATIFGATGLAFSAHMIIRGNWSHYATEVVVVGFALMAIELFVTKRVWHLVPFALVFLIIRGVFHTYVWTLVLLGYTVLRLWVFYGNRYRKQFEALGKMILLYCLGLLISAAVLLPNFYALWGSARVSGEGASYGGLLSTPVLTVNEPKEWLSSLFSLFAPDLLGRGSYYAGWCNYLEGPHLYAGLFILLLFPQVIYARSSRVRWVVATSLLVTALYLIVPWARYSLNAFAGEYYKTSSFWVSIFLCCAAVIALDNLVRNRKLNLPLLLFTYAGLMGAMLLLWRSSFVAQHIGGADYYVYEQVLVLLSLYAVFLAFLKYERLRGYGMSMLLLVLACEVALFAGGSSQDRLALRGDSIKTGGYFYEDSLEAIRKIQSDDEQFYRIERVSSAVSLNDALGQNYYGLKSYHSFNSTAYLRFLGKQGFNINYELIKKNTAYITGLNQRDVMETLLSVKYYLALEEDVPLVPEGYDMIDTVGRYNIYRNTHFLPLGFVYYAVATESEALKLSSKQRELLALEAAIVADPMAELLGFPLVSDERVQQLQQYTDTSQRLARSQLVQEKYNQLRTNSLKFSHFSHNSFDGTIELDQPGLLFLSIPDEEGWSYLVDGKEQEVVRTHFGLTGIVLPAGVSHVQGKYFPPLLATGLMLSSLGLAIYFLFLIVTPFSFMLRQKLQPPAKCIT